VSEEARFELLTRDGCHLCDDMDAVVRPILASYGLALDSVDVDASADLNDRFGESIPILLRDGKVVAKVRISERQVHRLVRRRRFWRR